MDLITTFLHRLLFEYLFLRWTMDTEISWLIRYVWTAIIGPKIKPRPQALRNIQIGTYSYLMVYSPTRNTRYRLISDQIWVPLIGGVVSPL
jgi:hypothetical protein